MLLSLRTKEIVRKDVGNLDAYRRLHQAYGELRHRVEDDGSDLEGDEIVPFFPPSRDDWNERISLRAEILMNGEAGRWQPLGCKQGKVWIRREGVRTRGLRLIWLSIQRKRILRERLDLKPIAEANLVL